MASGATKVLTGAFEGTGAEVNVRTVGFRPRRVELYNVSGFVTGVWVEGMADASVIKRVTAGTMSVPTSGGVTPLSDGFKLGTDSDLNVTGELVRFVASD